MRFAFVKEQRHVWKVETICRVMQATARGFRACVVCTTGARQRGNMKVLADIRERDILSLGSYGRPRMTMELKEAGLKVSERRIGRLMRINGIKPAHTCKHKVTTNSNHSLRIAPNVLDGDFAADAPNQKWAGDIKLRPQSSSTSMGSTTYGGVTHISAVSVRWRSSGRWHK